MNLKTRKLTVRKNASMLEFIPIEGNFDITGFRISSYIKAKLSDTKPVAVLDGKAVPSKKGVEIYLTANKSRELPHGQLIYFVELSKGSTQLIFSNYIDVHPS